MHPRKTHIALVEDAFEWASALRTLLDAEPDLAVVAHCGRLTEAAEILPQVRPEIVLLDLQLPDGLGSSLIPHLASVLPDCRFLILTVEESDDAIRTAIASGAEGYILKRAGFSRIVTAIRELRDGESPFCRWVAKRLLNFIRESSSPHRILGKLSPRENELVRLICGDGVSVKEAAFQLKLTHASARTYLQRIYRKLGVTTRWELDRAYFNLGRATASQPSLAPPPRTLPPLPSPPPHALSRLPLPPARRDQG